jgi:bacterioferritin
MSTYIETSAEQELHIAETVLVLNQILESELAGVVRYTHYSFMVFGPNRIPITGWLRSQASESLMHSQEAGELITHLGEHPSLGIGPLLETQKHDVFSILEESLDHETHQLNLYKKLLCLVQNKSVLLEEYARRMISEEEMHTGEVRKMMRK